MTTDTVLKRRGSDVLSETLGLVDAERFISLILREPFDYTEQQRDLYKDISLDDFYRNVKDFREKRCQNQQTNEQEKSFMVGPDDHVADGPRLGGGVAVGDENAV